MQNDRGKVVRGANTCEGREIAIPNFRGPDLFRNKTRD
jgi:hypothetical protein